MGSREAEKLAGHVWIVYDDEDTFDIYAVFDNRDDAERYAEEVKDLAPNGLKYAEYSVPWRLTDRSTRIEI